MARRLSSFEYERAAHHTEREDLTEPRARVARYDRRSRQVFVELTNSAKFVFPADLAQGLAGASAEDLSSIEISPSGEALRWPTLDADLSLPELMRGIFGSRSWMQRLRRESRPLLLPQDERITFLIARPPDRTALGKFAEAIPPAPLPRPGLKIGLSWSGGGDKIGPNCSLGGAEVAGPPPLSWDKVQILNADS